MTTYNDGALLISPIANKLIAAHHPHLADQRIEYVLRDKAARSKGRVVLGKARRVSGLNAFLARDPESGVDDPEDFLCVEIASDTWQMLDDAQRVALVDHELCHFVAGRDADGEWDGTIQLAAHDVEEFASVVRRHGLWRPEIDEFVHIGAQGNLFERAS